MADNGDCSDRLYGVVGAERLHDDPVGVYESEIEPFHDEHDLRPVPIEEWTIAPQRNHLMSADRLIEWVVETACDDAPVDEDWCDHLTDCGERADVKEAAEAFLSLLASKNQYRMADRCVATHEVTWDADGEPLLDGEPMYRPATHYTSYGAGS